MPVSDDEAWAERIRKECDSGNQEEDHIAADDILCELLTALGYKELVKAYRAVPKWYA